MDSDELFSFIENLAIGSGFFFRPRRGGVDHRMGGPAAIKRGAGPGLERKKLDQWDTTRRQLAAA